MNKIGKNPHLVSDRETLDSDWRQMNALLKALSVNADPQSPNANAIEDNLRELVRLDLIGLSGYCHIFIKCLVVKVNVCIVKVNILASLRPPQPITETDFK